MTTFRIIVDHPGDGWRPSLGWWVTWTGQADLDWSLTKIIFGTHFFKNKTDIKGIFRQHAASIYGFIHVSKFFVTSKLVVTLELT